VREVRYEVRRTRGNGKNEAKKRKIHTDRQLVDKKTRRES